MGVAVLCAACVAGHAVFTPTHTGVAARLAGRIKALVYLDAFLPADGESATTLLRTAMAVEAWPLFLNGFRDAGRPGSEAEGTHRGYALRVGSTPRC